MTWPGQRRFSSRSAPVSKSTATCRPKSNFGPNQLKIGRQGLKSADGLRGCPRCCFICFGIPRGEAALLNFRLAHYLALRKFGNGLRPCCASRGKLSNLGFVAVPETLIKGLRDRHGNSLKQGRTGTQSGVCRHLKL
jgi:hypothetical protein